jgi:hypothetical protein
MDNFKISITIGDTNKNFIVKQSTIKPDNKSNKFEDVLNDLGLEKVSYSKLIPKSEKVKHNNNNECSVCIHEYKIGEFKRKLICGHEYHKKCIDKWLKDCITCPICRKEIKTSLEE